MSQDGLWAMVRVTSTGGCPGPGWSGTKPVSKYTVSIGDRQATASAIDPDLSLIGGRGRFYGVLMGVPRGQGCYLLVVMTQTRPTRDGSIPLVLQWLGSFRPAQ